MLEAAEQSAAELRAEAAEEIEASCAKAQAVAERLSTRADEIERSLQRLADSVRDELSALKADLEELRAVGEGVAAEARGGGRSAASRAPSAAEPPQPSPCRRSRSPEAAEEPAPRRGARAAQPAPDPASAPRPRRPRGRARDRAQHGPERLIARGDRALPLRELRARRPRGAARRGLRPRRRLKIGRASRRGRGELDQVAVRVADVGHVLAPGLRLRRLTASAPSSIARSKAACTSSVTKQTSKAGRALAALLRPVYAREVRRRQLVGRECERGVAGVELRVLAALVDEAAPLAERALVEVEARGARRRRTGSCSRTASRPSP